MTTPMTTRSARTVAALSSIAVALGGCTSAGTPAAPSSEPRPTPAVALASGPGDQRCEHAEFTAEQFAGEWTESGEMVTTLVADGTVTSRGAVAGAERSGTWRYAPWAAAPGGARIPDGQSDRCVLWLHWTTPAPAMDSVYIPLSVTDTALQLSYAGRGNTLTWVRPTPAED